MSLGGGSSYRYFVVAAIGLFLVNVVASALGGLLTPYRNWLWVAVLLALVLAIILHRLESDGKQPEAAGIDEARRYKQARDRYLERIARRCRYLPLSAVDVEAATPDSAGEKRLALADVYVGLDTTAAADDDDPDSKRSRLASREERENLSALAALARERRVVLTGDPGGGKSTFLNHLTLCLANDTLDPRGGWSERLSDWPETLAGALPVPVTLREFAAWARAGGSAQRKVGLLHEYLSHWLAELGLEDFEAPLRRHLEEGSAVLLLDGLDEVPVRDGVLERVKEAIDDVLDAYPETPAVVTCRVLSYQDKRWRLAGEGWALFELASLGESHIDRFITAWYEQLAALELVRDAEVLSGKLQRAVRREHLWRLAGNPLLLTVMAQVHSHKGALPDAAPLLYKEVVELLLWRWDTIRDREARTEDSRWRRLLRDAGLQDSDIEQRLWELAYQIHCQMGRAEMDDEPGEATADIAETELIEALRELHPAGSRDWAARLVEVMKLGAGLLVETTPGVYGFPHRTLQEYLAACHLASRPEFSTRCLDLSSEGAFWRGVIMLAVGRLVHTSAPDLPLALVEELCPEGAPEGDAEWRRVWLAGECLSEIGVARAERKKAGKRLLPQVRGHLVELLETSALTPRERCEAGSVLGAIGDPRGLEEMVAVPEGEFWMGSGEDEAGSFDDERPRHQVAVAGFRISKYPVTNQQYEAFVAAAGHEPPPHWRGTTAPPELRNHPVAAVSWHDACAFCAWLATERGETVRLPTEAEWEKAARGVEGRIWPWGDEFDPALCNMSETGIGETSPVGSFPLGASPCGALEMAGNIWEWTASLWGEEPFEVGFGYPYDPSDGRESETASDAVLRVLRGGAFDDNRQDVRCAYRIGYLPSYRFSNVGFRVLSPGL